MTREEIINGLISIKHFVQDAVLKANFENKGEQDCKEVGETIDFALNAIKQIDEPKWHKGVPKEAGDYIVYFDNKKNWKGYAYLNVNINDNGWTTNYSCIAPNETIVAWQKIEPFEEDI